MRPRPLFLALALAALWTALPGTLARGGRKPDQFWAQPDLERRHLRVIAILPPVGDTPQGMSALEDQWFLRVYKDGHAWLPSSMAMDYFCRNPRVGEALLGRIRYQVGLNGQVDSATATQATRALGAEAVFVMRVDEWTRFGNPPALTIARVQATCALQDSSGHVLWKVSGVEEVKARYGVPTGPTGLVWPRSGIERLADLALVPAAFAAGAGTMVLATTQGAPSTTPPPSGTILPRPGVNSPPSTGGGSSQPRYYDPSKTYMPSDGEMRGRSPALNRGLPSVEGRLAPDFSIALGRLLDRWVALFPKVQRASGVAKAS